MAVDPRTSVIVGVGQSVENIGDSSYRGMSSVELATAAAQAALSDTGVDTAAVVQAIDTVAGIRQFEISGRTPAPLGKSNKLPAVGGAAHRRIPCAGDPRAHRRARAAAPAH